MLDDLKRKVELNEGVHCVIGDRYCSYKDSGYIDEFYINANSFDDIQIYYDRKTYMYHSFDEMINDKIFNGKSINELSNIIFLESDR